MNIMFLQGAGGTGKSSVIKAIEKLWEVGPKEGLYTLSSSTRVSYAKLGIDSETASLEMDDVTRIKLQEQIMLDWSTAITQRVSEVKSYENSENALLVVDRGPFDRMAYWLLTMMECYPGSTDLFMEKSADLVGWFFKLQINKVIFVGFPFPVSWAVQDNFRTPNELQTFALGLMIDSMCRKYHKEFSYESQYWDVDPNPNKASPPEDRARHLMNRYNLLLENGNRDG